MPAGVSAEITVEPNEMVGPTKHEILDGFSKWIGAAEVEDGETRLKRELKEIDEMTGEQALERVHQLRGRFMAMSRDYLGRVGRVAANEELKWPDEDLRKTEEVLKYWSVLNRKAELAEQNLDTKFHPDDLWTGMAEDMRRKLDMLLNPSSADRTGLIARALVSQKEEDVEKIDAEKDSAVERTDIVESLFASKEFTAKGELIEYLTCELWLSKLNITEQEYDRESEMNPMIRTGLVACVRDGNTEAVEQSLDQLLAYGNSEIAASVFDSTELSYAEKDRFAVSYINTFGYLKFVEMLAPLAQRADDNKRLFNEYSGQETAKIIEKLDKVYDESLEDFMEHYSESVTKKEVGLVKKILEEVVGKRLSEAKVLEVAAGFGRLAKEVLEAGCGYLTAVEPHEKMFEILADNIKTHPNFRPIQGTWENLKKYSLDEQDLGVSLEGTDDLGVCLGRSLPHANSPERALVAFGQMLGVAKTWLIDEPAPEVGYYDDYIKNLEQTLHNKGVNDEKTHLIYDSPDGKHFFHRMIMGGEQLDLLGELLGFKIREIDQDTIPGDQEVMNIYYLIEKDEDFDVLDLIESGRLIEIVKELGMNKRGLDFDMVPEGWGMSLGQAIVCASQGDEAMDYAMQTLSSNEHYGEIPKMDNSYGRNGKIVLRFASRDTSNTWSSYEFRALL